MKVKKVYENEQTNTINDDIADIIHSALVYDREYEIDFEDIKKTADRLVGYLTRTGVNFELLKNTDNYNIKGVNKISYTEDEIKNIYRKEKIGRIVTSNNKPFIIDETTFRTLGEASDKLGLHKMTIKTRLLSKNFPNYKYVENENEINVILLEYEKKYLS